MRGAETSSGELERNKENCISFREQRGLRFVGEGRKPFVGAVPPYFHSCLRASSLQCREWFENEFCSSKWIFAVAGISLISVDYSCHVDFASKLV